MKTDQALAPEKYALQRVVELLNTPSRHTRWLGEDDARLATHLASAYIEGATSGRHAPRVGKHDERRPS